MFTTILAFLARIGLGGIVSKVTALLEHRASEQTEQAKLKTLITVEVIKAAVEDAKIQGKLQEKKLGYNSFWVLIYAFACPLALWWGAVVLDSVFHFGWNVANLPTPQMQVWAGDMIKWIFGTGIGVAGLKALAR